MLYTEQYEAKLRGVWEDYGEERGMEKGREEGIGIGREEGHREIISLIEKGVSLNEIKQILANRE